MYGSIKFAGQKRSLSMEVEMVEGMLSEVEHQLSSGSHASLIRNSTELFRMLKQMQKSPPVAPHLPIQADFERCFFVNFWVFSFVECCCRDRATVLLVNCGLDSIPELS